MRRSVWVLGVLASSASLAACASILGIDDGIPREDGGLGDATLDVVAGDSGGEGGDATPDAIADAGPDVPVDALEPFSPLSCGNTTCNAVTQGCCRTGQGSDASPYGYVCVDDGGACASNSAVLVECDRAANCTAQGKPGHVCCANTPLNTKATAATCLSPGACGVSVGTILCGPGDDELCTAQGRNCLASSVTIVGWDICR
ncbi:MAG TPA: hypothetical protein VF316_22265 [Polyangiaceae bacterium]